jgi:hypothetical protein
MRLWAATFAVIFANMTSVALANDGSSVAPVLNRTTAAVRTAANLGVPAVRPNGFAPARVAHRRPSTVLRRAGIRAPNVIQVAYRPAADTSCSRSWCAQPFTLILGITY